MITDTLGLLLAVLVRPADVQDRAGATTLLLGLYLQSGCRMVFADQGFAGRLVAWARQVLGIIVYIVGKPAGQLRFQVHPRRWVAERTLGWLLAHRRLARDYERRPEISEAMIGGPRSACWSAAWPAANPPSGQVRVHSNVFGEPHDHLSNTF